MDKLYLSFLQLIDPHLVIHMQVYPTTEYRNDLTTIDTLTKDTWLCLWLNQL